MNGTSKTSNGWVEFHIDNQSQSPVQQKDYNPNVGVFPIKVNGKSYSRNQIAKGTGVHRSAICKIFRGERKPSLIACLRLAMYMEISIEHLIGVVIPTNIHRQWDREAYRQKQIKLANEGKVKVGMNVKIKPVRELKVKI